MRRFRIVVIALLAGCTGEITGVGSGDVQAEPDAAAAPAPSMDAATSDTPPAPAGFACRDRVTAGLGSGRHNPGQDCMSNCHNHGFTVGGTLRDAGGAALSGGTITLVDATGKSVDIVSQLNGNFYTSQAIAFPVKVYASACPDIATMVAQVQSADAGCNRSGCHAAGGTGPVHVP